MGASDTMYEFDRNARTVRTRNGVYPLNLKFEQCKVFVGDVELPIQIRARFAFHLVVFAEGKHALADNAQDLFEYVSSQQTLEAILNAERKKQWPEESQAAGKRVLSL